MKIGYKRKGLFAFVVLYSAMIGTAVAADSRNTSAHSLPGVLSVRDVHLYKRVFALQRIGKWAKATELFKKIDDKSLESHILFQRYMHPTKHRALFSELKSWLKQFPDRPGAYRIYRLAKKRSPTKNTKIPRPKLPQVRGVLSEDIIFSNGASQKRKISDDSSKDYRRFLRRLNRLIAKRRTTDAHTLVKTKRNSRALKAHELARAYAALARGYYHEKKDQLVVFLANRAEKQKAIGKGDANWWAGLASWRLGNFEKSAIYFSKLSQDRTIMAPLQTAAAFWAARAYLRAAQPVQVNHYLSIAAQKPRTFYGMLACDLLGTAPELNWHIPPLKARDVDAMQRHPRLRRALALIQLDQWVRAEAEMNFVTLRDTQQNTRILLNIATRGKLPRLSYRLGHTVINEGGELFDSALYPLPAWKPKNGFFLDKALIFALMRQESRFRSRARSRMGATGLMQLMPRTARDIAGHKMWDGRRSSLSDPVLSITLGQRYLHRLIKNDFIGKNLFYIIAAYNSGPGNLFRWQKELDYQSDPLVFIESIPARETRIFVERVLANYWIYREHLKQKTPSLHALASGKWPTYITMDQSAKDLMNDAR